MRRARKSIVVAGLLVLAGGCGGPTTSRLNEGQEVVVFQRDGGGVRAKTSIDEGIGDLGYVVLKTGQKLVIFKDDGNGGDPIRPVKAVVRGGPENGVRVTMERQDVRTGE